MDNDIDIMAITETWLKGHENCEFATHDICPSGYVFSHVPREFGSGGGVGIIFKHSLKIEKLTTTKSFKSFELMQLLLHKNSVTTHIVVIYRPPPSSTNGFTVNLFFDEFSSLLELLVSSSGKLLITGDFNIHVNDTSAATALKFLDLLDSFNLIQHISMPTHKNSNTLDLIITRSDEETVCNLSVNDPVISDHFVLHCNLNLAKPTKIVTCRKIRSINTEKLHNDINQLVTIPIASACSFGTV